MADGSTYTIDIQAKAVGVDTSAEQLNALANQLQSAGVVSTQFDSAIQRTSTLLAEASAASAAAADAVAQSEAKYSQLEKAAQKAGKAVERAALQGKDTSQLQAAADAAASALRAEGVALEELRARSEQAASAQEELEATMSTLTSAAGEEAAQVGKSGDRLGEAAKKASGPFGELAERVGALKTLIVSGGIASGGILIAAAFTAMAVGAVIAIASLAKLAVTLNKAAMEKLSKSTERAKESFAKLFSGINVDKFVSAYEDVVGLLDESSSSAKGVKLILETLLNPIFDSAPGAGSLIKELFRGFVIGALNVATVAVQTRNAVSRLIPPDIAPKIDYMTAALKVGKYAIIAAAIACGVLTVAFLALLACVAITVVLLLAPIIIIGLLVAAFLWLGGVILNAASGAISALTSLASGAAQALSGLASGAVEVAGQIIQGLVSGIQSGAGVVFEALRALGGGAMAALKSALGIASPSKFAMSLAGNVTTTFSDTVDEGAPEVQDSFRGMVEPPDMPSPTLPRGEAVPPNVRADVGHGAKGGMVVNLSITAPDGDARSIAQEVERVFVRLLEGQVTMLGGAVVA